MFGEVKGYSVQRGVLCISLSVVATFLSVSFLFDVQLSSDWITSSSASSTTLRSKPTTSSRTRSDGIPADAEGSLLHCDDDEDPILAEDDFFPEGFKPHPNVFSEVFLPRGKPLDGKDRLALANSWGSWTFVDPKGSSLQNHRPQNDYFSAYPNRDLPRSKFPSNAWQIDPDYLNRFLPEAKALVKRAMEAILTEYGHGPDQAPLKSFDERSQMFRVEVSPEEEEIVTSGPNVEAGGYMPQHSWNSLVKRLWHAMMTQDTFVIVTAGHSAAAGKGNHFQQSYTLQTQLLLEPILARLGVAVTTNNLAMGAMGTSQTALGFKDLYGDDIDILLYDSGMTEPDIDLMDLFARQSILSGQKVPLLWIKKDYRRFFSSGIYSYLANECQADVAVFGSGMVGVPTMDTMDDANSLPYATRFMSCDNEIADACQQHKYLSQCWIDREGVNVTTKQGSVAGGQGGWHPGFRVHKLQSRVLAFTLLAATEEALDLWTQQAGYEVDDAAWHMQSHYDTIKSNLLTLNHTTPCHSSTVFPTRACDVPMHGRTEFTPRPNPYQTGLRRIAHEAHRLDDQLIPNLYDPPDTRNWMLDTGDVDIVNIIENGVDYEPIMGRRRRRRDRLSKVSSRRDNRSDPTVNPGTGWSLSTKSAPDNCDGSYDSFCGRSDAATCLLDGHDSDRGGLLFDSNSGWLVLTLSQVQHGLITVKIDDRQTAWDFRTNSWIFGNNLCQGTGLTDATDLNSGTQPTCEDFNFEFSISGKVTTWNCRDWRLNERKPHKVVQLWTLLDDETFVNDPQTPQDIELGIRATGCGNNTLMLSHVYWA